MFYISLLLVILIVYCTVVLFSLGSLAASIKGSPYVPTPQNRAREMLSMAKLGKKDTLFDLGSGDGRILIAAAKKGVRAHGWEINPILFILSRIYAYRSGVSKFVHVHPVNYRRAPLSDATVITIYGLPYLVNDIGEKVKTQVKEGTRIVSYRFPITSLRLTAQSKNKIYLYTL